MSEESRFIKHLREVSSPMKGLAMIAVVYAHFIRLYYAEFINNHWWFDPGFCYLAPSVFFILSGYWLAFSSLRKSPLRWRDFFLRRASRIIPLYYLSMVFVLLCYLLVFKELKNTMDMVYVFIPKALFIHNYSPKTIFTLNSTYWFVGAIVGLYLVFPLLFVCMRKHPGRTLFVSMMVSYLTSFFIRYSPIHDMNPYLAMGGFPLTRLAEFSLGAWVAVVSDRVPDRFDRYAYSPIAPLIAIGLLALGLLGHKYEYLYPFNPLLITSALMFYLVYTYRFLHKILLPLFLVLGFVGVYSYSIYLFHRPFIEPWLIYFELYFNLKYGLNLSALGLASVYVVFSILVFSAVEMVYNFSVSLFKKRVLNR
jgi:peptidoglycan/LPS O-acetylase OafA/YrhL